MSELFDNDRGLQIDQVIVGVGEEGMPFMSAVHCGAGSDLEMNFGTVSLAAPQAASSRVSRYSRTDRRVLAMASSQPHHTQQQNAACWHRTQSGWLDRKSGPLDQPFCHAAADHGLKQLSQQVTIAEDPAYS
jgi:hypothetical protein